ncbi:MAG: hypothetical protein D3903_22500 [Candidatus Electrothrix sp. GM3_4]|nr:hypothetical protein [Candidatus Electrothrix sp. GM3_4]
MRSVGDKKIKTDFCETVEASLTGYVAGEQESCSGFKTLSGRHFFYTFEDDGPLDGQNRRKGGLEGLKRGFFVRMVRLCPSFFTASQAVTRNKKCTRDGITEQNQREQ